MIPVIIDNCKVPECLNSTVWQRIYDLSNYDEEINRIVMSIMGQTEKPPIGSPPKYASTIIDNFSGLNKVDSIIFKIACETEIKTNSIYIVSDCVFEEVNKLGIDKSTLSDTLYILYNRGYINATKIISGDIPIFDITTYGFNQYVSLYINDFDFTVENVCYNIVNVQIDNVTVAYNLNKPMVLVNHVYNLLKQRGLINFNVTLNGDIILFDVSPELKRMLQ